VAAVYAVYAIRSLLFMLFVVGLLFMLDKRRQDGAANAQEAV
jgi:hypothetical protein